MLCYGKLSKLLGTFSKVLTHLTSKEVILYSLKDTTLLCSLQRLALLYSLQDTALLYSLLPSSTPPCFSVSHFSLSRKPLYFHLASNYMCKGRLGTPLTGQQ